MNAIPDGKNRVTCIKISRELADLAKVYCIFNKQTLENFTTNLFQKELDDFKRKLDSMKQLKGDS